MKNLSEFVDCENEFQNLCTTNPLWWLSQRGRWSPLSAPVRVNLLRPLESDMGGGGGRGLEAWFRALSGLWFGSEEGSVGITVENGW